jgi:membrane dipeptidase
MSQVLPGSNGEPDGYEFGRFDFGLSEEQERRAARLHEESIVIDLLWWGPVTYRSYSATMENRLKEMYARHQSPGQSVWDSFYLAGRMAVAGEFPQYQAAWRASGLTGGHYPMRIGTPEVLLTSASHWAMLVDHLPWVRKALCARDFVEAKKAGQLALFGQCQPIEPVARDLTLLEQAYNFGMRVLMLTYNNQDLVGSGCTDRTNGGVTNFGRELIRLCNEMGIVVDTPHSAERTTLDACEFSTTPVVASHTGAKALYRHDRSKTDAEIKAIAATGGVVGVFTDAFFLTGSPERYTIMTWLDHVDYIASLVGPEHVAIGTDSPFAGPKWAVSKMGEWSSTTGFRPAEHSTDPQTVTKNLVGFDDYRDLINMTRGLVARNYTDEQIRGILGANALRVFEQAIG